MVIGVWVKLWVLKYQLDLWANFCRVSVFKKAIRGSLTAATHNPNNLPMPGLACKQNIAFSQYGG